jgi:hypothetical protein
MGEFVEGNAAIATKALTGVCGVVSLGDSIDALDEAEKLRHLRFRNLVGCRLRPICTIEPVNPGTVTGNFALTDTPFAGPGATPGNYYLHTRNIFNVTAGATMPADNAPNDNRVFDIECSTTAGIVYRPRGVGRFLDGKNIALSFLSYRNATGISSFKLAATNYGVTSEYATLTGQSANGAAGVVQHKIPSVGIHNHGTDGFRLRAKLTGGSVVATGSNFVCCDGFVEVVGETGQTFASLAFSGWRALDYITTSNITAAAFATQLQLLRAAIVFIKLDENSLVNGESTSTYTTRMAALMDLCKTANPDMQFVIFSQYDNTAAGITSANLRLIALAGRDLVLSRAGNDALWLDCNGAFGDTGYMVDANLVDTDTVHPTTAGAIDQKKTTRVVMAQNEMLEMAHAANSVGNIMAPYNLTTYTHP